MPNIELKNNSHITINGGVGNDVYFGGNTISIEEGSYLTLSADALNGILSDCGLLSTTERLNQLKAFLPIGWSIQQVEDTYPVLEMGI